jgi:hypothetical protein
MAKEKTTNPQLPGMPGPDLSRVAQREAIESALGQLHDALLPTVEALPCGNGTQSSVSFRKKIKGDTFQVTLQPGQGQ